MENQGQNLQAQAQKKVIWNIETSYEYYMETRIEETKEEKLRKVEILFIHTYSLFSFIYSAISRLELHHRYIKY